MALSRLKTWTAEELTSVDLNAEFDNILNNAVALVSPFTANVSAGGYRVIGLGAGSVGSPSLQFTGDTDTGIYSPGANQVGLAAGGVGVFNIFGGAAAANTYLYGLWIAPSYTEAATGVHPIESSLYVAAPTITGGVATATLGSTVYIAGPTTGTVTSANYALYVSSGNVRFNDEVYFGANQISTGDLVNIAKLSVGTTGQVLRMGATAPAWDTAGSEWYTPKGLTLSNNVADDANDIDIAAGDANSDDASPINREVMYLAVGLTKKLDVGWAVGTGVGMLATGAAVANGTYHIFLIKRPDTGVVDIAADSSVTGANVFANTNVAYTKKRRIGSIIRVAAAIQQFVQTGDEFLHKTTPLSDVQSLPPASTDAIDKVLSVPTGISVIAIVNACLGGHATGTALLLSALSQTNIVPTTYFAQVIQPSAGAGAHYASGQVHVRTDTAATIRTRVSATDGTTLLYIGTHGWIDTRST